MLSWCQAKEVQDMQTSRKAWGMQPLNFLSSTIFSKIQQSHTVTYLNKFGTLYYTLKYKRIHIQNLLSLTNIISLISTVSIPDWTKL